MNIKRWLAASLAAFAIIFVLEFITHGILLDGIYQQTASVWRSEPEIERMMWLFWLGYFVFALFFTLIYTKGYESGKSGFGQGVRFGVFMGVILSVMQSVGWYVVLPIPGALAFYWFAATMTESVAAGIAVGLIYRP